MTVRFELSLETSSLWTSVAFSSLLLSSSKEFWALALSTWLAGSSTDSGEGVLLPSFPSGWLVLPSWSFNVSINFLIFRICWSMSSALAFLSESKRLLSSVSWRSWLESEASLLSFTLTTLSFSSSITWRRADLSATFAGFSSKFLSANSWLSGKGSSLALLLPSSFRVFSVAAVSGDTDRLSALATPFAKNKSAATATLAAPKWYFLME